jgi:cyd operon protein YbgT
MWYFTWVLGLTMAVLLAVLNAMWFEVQEANEGAKAQKDRT